MTARQAKRAAKARAVAPPDLLWMPEAPWLVTVPPELIGDAAGLAKVVGSHRLALGYDGPLIVSACTAQLPANLELAIYGPARGHA